MEVSNMKTYKFKLYNSKKNKKLQHQLWVACKVYNHCIALHKRYWHLFHKSLNKNELQKHLTKLKKQKDKAVDQVHPGVFSSHGNWHQYGSKKHKGTPDPSGKYQGSKNELEIFLKLVQTGAGHSVLHFFFVEGS